MGTSENIDRANRALMPKIATCMNTILYAVAHYTAHITKSDPLLMQLPEKSRTALLEWCEKTYTAAEKREFSEVVRQYNVTHDIVYRENHHQKQIVHMANKLANRQPLKPELVPTYELLKSGLKEMERVLSKLKQANKPIILQISRRYRNFDDLDDLEQEGNIALQEAALRYDLARGSKFRSYASRGIQNHMRRYVENTARIIRCPVARFGEISRLKKVSEKYSKDLPDRDESICEELNWTTKKLSAVRESETQTISISTPLNEDFTLEDVLTDETTTAAEQLHERHLNHTVHSVLTELKPQEAEVLRRVYGIDCDPEKLREIGVDLGFSRQRVDQIHVKALQRLRHPSRIQKLKGFI